MLSMCLVCVVSVWWFVCVEYVFGVRVSVWWFVCVEYVFGVPVSVWWFVCVEYVLGVRGVCLVVCVC